MDRHKDNETIIIQKQKVTWVERGRAQTYTQRHQQNLRTLNVTLRCIESESKLIGII